MKNTSRDRNIKGERTTFRKRFEMPADSVCVLVSMLLYTAAEGWWWRRGREIEPMERGFVLVGDFWGNRAWENWEYEVSQVLPLE